jgi:hypothetical protein
VETEKNEEGVKESKGRNRKLKREKKKRPEKR